MNLMARIKKLEAATTPSETQFVELRHGETREECLRRLGYAPPDDGGPLIIAITPWHARGL